MNRDGLIDAGHGLSLPAAELVWRFVRSSGPGGQNVNKVATAAELRWDLRHSIALPVAVHQRLAVLARTRINADGVLVIRAERHRTQERNRADALERLLALVQQAAIPPKPRKATKPSRGSRKRRLEGKRKDSQKKTLRRKVFD